MTKLAEYRAALTALPAADWEPYLLAHSNLPGPRGNLELAAAAADLGDEAQFRRWAGLGPDVAPENTPECFLAFCGVVGLGEVMAGRGKAFRHELAATTDISSEAGLSVAAGCGESHRDAARCLAPTNVARPRLRLRAGASGRRWRWRCNAGAMRTWPRCWPR